MTKEKETELKEVKEKKSEVYNLSEQILRDGYKATIDGRLFMVGFDISPNGEKMSQYASVMKQVSNPGRGGGQMWKATDVYSLEDLSDEQLRLLALAGVITLTKEQEKIYAEKFYK